MKYNEVDYGTHDKVEVKVVEHGTNLDVRHVQITPRWNGDSRSDDVPDYKLKMELALLSHSTKASHCEIGQRTRCDGPKFRLRVHAGYNQDHILIGKLIYR